MHFFKGSNRHERVSNYKFITTRSKTVTTTTTITTTTKLHAHYTSNSIHSCITKCTKEPCQFLRHLQKSVE